MRTFAVVANEKWIVWLHSLDPVTRELIMRDELFYFDEWNEGRMGWGDVLDDARASLLYV